MGYSECLEAAGCEVLDFAEFGDYQGTWLALVKLNGEIGIVEGSYGSCSGCDAYQAEFDFDGEPAERDGKFFKNDNTWDDENICTEAEFIKHKEVYQKRLSDFGLSYLAGGLYDKAHYELRLSQLDKDDYFDSETKEYCQWAVEKLTQHQSL